MKKQLKLTKEQKISLSFVDISYHQHVIKRITHNPRRYCPWMGQTYPCFRSCWPLFPQTENRYRKDREKAACPCNFLSPTYIQRKFRYLLFLYLSTQQAKKGDLS